MRWARRRAGWALTLGLLAAVAAPAAAQRDRGLELALDGPTNAFRGRSWVGHGVVYGVRSLAELDPAPGATITARALRTDGPSAELARTQASADGSFVIRVPVPVDEPGGLRLELTVAHEGVERAFEVPLGVMDAQELTLRTDRRFYHPGEPAHAWALVRDHASLAPLADQPVALRLDRPDGTTANAVVRTDASGVAHHVFELGDAATGGARVTARLSEQSQVVAIQVGQRTQERLLLQVEWPEEHVAPSGTFHPEVRVIAPSGEPARDAAITLTVDGMTPVHGRTDQRGVWKGTATAPAYLANDTGTVQVSVIASHPAIGTARISATLHLASAGGYQVRAFTAGSLAFDLATPVYFALSGPTGERAPAGVSFTVRTPLARGGEVRLSTDANGLAETTLRAATMHAVPGVCGDLGVAFEVEDAEGRTREICVPAATADVLVRPTEPVREPGQPLTVRLERHRRVARRPLVVTLHRRGTEELLDVRVVPATRDEVTFETPAALGALVVRAHPRLDEDTALSAVGVASEAGVLVRPPAPSFVRVEPTAPTYEVGATAAVKVHTGPTAGWVAVDVRDLAQHGGEPPFRLASLHGRFDRAVLDPSTEDADRLIRAALAASTQHPMEPNRARPVDFGPGPDLGPVEHGRYSPRLDPVVAARLVARRAGGQGMATVEAALRNRGAEAVTTGDGSRRRFDPASVDAVLAEAELRTLGDRPLRLAHLKVADPTFSFALAARRIARERLIRALQQLVAGIDGGHIDGDRPERWVSEMVRHTGLDPRSVRDPWGGPLGARRRPQDVLAPSPDASEWTLAFPGPDGRLGTGDDVVDPFARIVPEGTLYAVASGEEALLHALSMIVPVGQTLTGWVQALQRVTEAMEATLRGDAASAEAIGESFGFGGLGLRGTGSGGGGSGYGRGMGARRARAPRIRMGHASVIDDLAQLSGRVREDFPGTLLFVPSAPTGDGGVTEIPIPLADAATTYLVEVIHWRPDGWSHSASTRFATEKPLIVEAPLPPVAHVGEVLRVPIRARSRAAMSVDLGVVAEGDVEVAIGPPQTVRVEAGGAAVAYVEVKVLSAGTGALVAVARGEGHDDAIRLPFRAVRDVRQLIRTDERLLHAAEPLVFGATERERDAWAMSPARVTLTSGEALFGGGGGGGIWSEWAAAFGGPRPTTLRTPRWGNETRTLLAAAARWADPTLGDEPVREILTAASATLDRDDGARTRALQLLTLAAAWRERDARPPLREDLERLRDALLAAVERDATESSEDPALHALAAGGLALHGETALAGEMARRARRSLVRFGEDLWLPATGPELGSRGASAALALADLELGEPAEAFALLRTIADRRRREPATHARLNPTDEGLARALAVRLAGGEPLEMVQVTLAGRERALTLGGGEATFTAKLRRGRGAVPVRVPEGHLVVAHVVTELGMPWPATTHRGGPLRVVVEAGAPRLDTPTEATLRIRNAVPRAIREPELTVTLPAGAVLDERARARLDQHLARPVTVEAGRLRMRLPPLLPGMSVELPLTLRYEVAGALSGFGVDAYPLDRDDRRTVVPPRTITIATPEEASR